MYPAEEFLDLKVGDQIIWEGEEIEVEGCPTIVSPAMKGKVISLHDGALPPPTSLPSKLDPETFEVHPRG